MAGPGLSTTRSTSSTTGHISDSNTVHSYVNELDTTFLTASVNGHVLTFDSTSGTWKPAAPTSGSNPFGSVFVTLSSFAGASDSAKFRQACLDLAGDDPMPILLIPPGTTLDSGANNPFVLPSYMHIMCTPTASSDEFGRENTINLRHTGSTTTLGVFQWASGSQSQHFTGISFKGTSTTRAFVDVALAGTDPNNPTYVVFTGVSFNQFESVIQTTGTGITWHGGCYLNNMAAGREPVYWAGSDHTLFSNGAFFELGTVGTYSTRVALSAMFRGGSLSNTSIGPVYWTGSPTTPVRLDGGIGGVNFTDAILEGRPSPGTTLWCAGPLARLTGGGARFMNREHGNAMRAPADVTAYSAGGFYHVSGGNHAIIGGTWQPYAAASYPSYTQPDGTTHTSGTLPPFAWVTNTTSRLTVQGIQRGSNASATPQVYVPAAASVNTVGANIITDNTVQVVTF